MVCVIEARISALKNQSARSNPGAFFCAEKYAAPRLSRPPIRRMDVEDLHLPVRKIIPNT
jgi:hypothetical protein